MVLSHRQIVHLSAIKYIQQLQSVDIDSSRNLQAVIENLIQSVVMALEKQDSFSAADMPFNGNMVSELTEAEREPLVNQYALGLGRANAPVVFIGTEHAYDLKRILPLNLEGIGLTLQWLCDGKEDVIEKIGAISWPHPVPFHIYPNLQYRVDQSRGQHTWIVISSILSRVYELPEYKELLTGYQPGLGDYAYQVEMSAFPSKQAHRGKMPSPERLEFLGDLLAAMRSSARVVVFHGKPNHRQWNEMRSPLIRRFLDMSAGNQVHFLEEDANGVRLK